MSLKEIAKELGLSLTTVSRALNGYPEVAEPTRLAVQQAAARRHYTPDVRARSLALGRADVAGIVFPITPGDLGDLLFLETAHAMSERLEQAGMDLIIVSASASQELAACRRALAGRRIDAFVVPRTRVADERLHLLLQHGAPFVAYGRSAALKAPYAWFDFDNEVGARLAAQRLLQLGHRHVGYLGAAPEYNFAAERFDGFSRALSEAGVVLRPEAVRRGALDRRSGYAAMQQLLALPQRPTALLVDNHLAGVGALHAALHAGVALGKDMSVIVYDGLGPDSIIRMRVTSIAQPTPAQVGTTLAEMLLLRVKGEAPARLQQLWLPVLVAGDTDGPAPA